MKKEERKGESAYSGIDLINASLSMEYSQVERNKKKRERMRRGEIWGTYVGVAGYLTSMKERGEGEWE